MLIIEISKRKEAASIAEKEANELIKRSLCIVYN